MKEAIITILNNETTLEAKLDMLTAIGTASQNEETFKVCEEIRNELCSEEVSQGREDLLRCTKHCDHCNDTGNEESNEVHGEE